MALQLTRSRDGVLLPVRARPRARRNGIDGMRNGALLVSVTTAPEDGRANAAIIKVLADALGCAQSTLRLDRGTTSRDKKVLVCGLNEDEICGRLTRFMAAP
jgi:uncharacterized protein (TIGR00251 family)